MRDEIVGDAFEIGGSVFGPGEAASGTRLALRQLLFKAGCDGIVREHLAAVDLLEAPFDFADEPVVIVNGPLDGFSRPFFGRNASTAGRTHARAWFRGLAAGSLPLSECTRELG